MSLEEARRKAREAVTKYLRAGRAIELEQSVDEVFRIIDNLRFQKGEKSVIEAYNEIEKSFIEGTDILEHNLSYRRSRGITAAARPVTQKDLLYRVEQSVPSIDLSPFGVEKGTREYIWKGSEVKGVRKVQSD